MRAVRPISLALVVVLAVPLAACSGRPGAQAWAALVCTTLSPWRAEIDSLTSRTQQQITAETSAGQAKENLARLFGGAAVASERARAGVEKAGVPDVTNGEAIATGFLDSLAGIRDAYDHARTGIEALATNPPKAFYNEVGKVVERLSADYQQSSLDTETLESVELRQAFDSLPECR
ncbi:hypothetical protein [Actinoplanes utahensis]|uniref:Lipoprotein n=1 Tax=Actinoplanes utahensis TaxID=1869 RepID=A0A0A6UU64_ACTUT|nr:hypothetical protein [Actinoplanes utahensis]KHD78518.1 hypothetical protein MB27_04730 [Actinoplanes utahensis]GIF31809.1 hypothetical protein Aut01nite_47950 [Actinoplanes utahensis]